MTESQKRSAIFHKYSVAQALDGNGSTPITSGSLPRSEPSYQGAKGISLLPPYLWRNYLSEY